jgi:hypothetical protein
MGISRLSEPKEKSQNYCEGVRCLDNAEFPAEKLSRDDSESYAPLVAAECNNLIAVCY